MINENDDWEIAVDTGEFDKRIEQQEKDRIALQINLKKSIVNNNDDNDNRNSSNINLFKPIRILKRPTSQSQLPVDNSSLIPNSSFSNENSSSITVSNISNIPQNQIKDSINSSQTIKTYEQREQEYRLARLRIMGEEESSAKDDDDDSTTIDTTSITSDETSNITLPVHSSLQNQINYGNNAVHFTSTGPFSQPQYRSVVYTSPYPSMPLSHYPPAGLYISSSSSNPWYEYQQQQQTPFGTQQYNHPQ